MRVIAMVLVFSASAAAEEPSLPGEGEPAPPCVPVGAARLPRISDLQSLLEWAEDAFCHPIVAPSQMLSRAVAIDAPDGEVAPAEQQRLFRAAVERLGLRLDASSRVWKLRAATIAPPARPYCRAYPANKKFVFELRGVISLAMLATVYEPMFCRPLAFHPQLADRRIGLFIPKHTPMTPPEVDGLIREALRASGAAFDDQRGLVVWDLPEPPAPPPVVAARCIGTPCRVERKLVNQLLADRGVTGTARFVPSIDEGVQRCLKLYAIRPGSILEEIGIQNGDCLLRVNGQAVRDPEKIADELRNTTHVTLEIERRGEPLTIKIDVD